VKSTAGSFTSSSVRSPKMPNEANTSNGGSSIQSGKTKVEEQQTDKITIDGKRGCSLTDTV
jgi:hypothetical protein